MFYDRAKFAISAGNGGDGAVSFRREKFIPRGGPDGGDGGKGGDIYLKCTNEINILYDYRNKSIFKADNGKNGMSKDKTGKSGEDLTFKIPVGTTAKLTDKKGETKILEFLEECGSILVARGGNGGWGNAHFATSIKQTPKWANNGQIGESYDVELELKLIADIGLVGLPNAGKSSLLGVISNAKPKIANYQFTTLEPMLGVVNRKNYHFVVADIPGIIEGAHRGKGLGIEFLKHISRNKLLLFVIDASSNKISETVKLIERELSRADLDLLSKTKILILNKIDLLDKKKITAMSKKFPKAVQISTITQENIDTLLDKIAEQLTIL